MYADLGDPWVPGLGNWMGDIVITETGNTGRRAGVNLDTLPVLPTEVNTPKPIVFFPLWVRS